VHLINQTIVFFSPENVAFTIHESFPSFLVIRLTKTGKMTVCYIKKSMTATIWMSIRRFMHESPVAQLFCQVELICIFKEGI